MVNMFILNWLKRRTPEKDLDALTKSLQEILGGRLKSVIVFGSYVRNEFDAKRSNLNVLIVTELPYNALTEMTKIMKPWFAKGYGAPVLVAPENLDDFARDFPIEFLDMKESHRVLAGENVLSALDVDKRHLESEIEHDLAVIQLKIRQEIVADHSTRAVLRALEICQKSIRVILRTARQLERERIPELDKMLTTFDGLHEELQRAKGDVVHAVASQYLNHIDSALAWLRKK
jgi:predicted nucleotidyltransferase